MKNINADGGVSGMLGEVITVKKVRGQVVVANRPKRKAGKPSPRQEAAREKFQEAVQYGKRQKSLPESIYGTGITPNKRSVHIVAMCDYLSAPKVSSIDTLGYRGAIGDILTVKAVDDFMVTRVRVIMTDAAGAVIEEGEAGPDQDKINLWEYKATVANPSLPGTRIQAIAYDRPGNTGTAEVVL